MSDFRYYEIIASRLFDIEPKDLSKVSRDPNIVSARNLCIYYRFKVLCFGRTASTKRYGKDHATSYHSIKYIENMCFSNKNFRQTIDNFMRECKIYLQVTSDEIDLKAKNSLQLSEQLDAIVKHFVRLQNGLCNYVADMKQDETYYIELLEPCIKSINELKAFFRYDDNKRDLGNKRTRGSGTKSSSS